MGVHIRIGKNTGDSNGPCTPRNSVVAAPVSGTIPFVSVNAPPRKPPPRSTRLPSGRCNVHVDERQRRLSGIRDDAVVRTAKPPRRERWPRWQ